MSSGSVRRGGSAARGFFAGFRDFIMRGNVVDLAVAVVIGAAFSKIIDSLVSDIITPLILTPALQAAGVDDISQLSAGGIQYGLFLAAVINFLVIAFSLYVVIKAFDKAKRKLMRQEAIAEEVDPNLMAQQNLTQAIENLTQVVERKPLA